MNCCKLADWLRAGQVTAVAMESTGVYWKPVFNILESEFKVYLVNARHIKYVPGRKSDISDSQWIGELLQHGLVEGQLHTGGATTRLARPDTLPYFSDTGTHTGDQPGAESVWKMPM